MTAESAVDALRSAGASVATAESLTGGLVAATLISVPGASAVVRGGVIAYAADIKTGVLGVDADLVRERGTVDPDVAIAMASRVRETCGATYGVATTGVAGPDPSEGHQPGTVHIAIAGPSTAESRTLALTGDREAVRTQTVAELLSWLAAKVGEESDADLRWT